MNKLIKLREKLNNQAFILPRTDAFQGEYIMPHDEAVAWLTGFTGSNGIVAVLPDKAALFTDGRYILQAQKQIDLSCYALYNLADLTPWKWLENYQGPILYDPWLFTPNQLKRYKDLTLISLTHNPIDELWIKDKPSKHPIQNHSLEYAGKSFQEKFKEVCKVLEKTEVFLLTDCSSICWLLNLRGRDIPYTPIFQSYAVIWKKGIVDVFIDLDKISKCIEIEDCVHFHALKDIEVYLTQITCSISVDPNSVPMKLVQCFKEEYIVYKSDPCILLKALKNAIERRGAIKAHIKDGVAVCDFLAWLEETFPDQAIIEKQAADYLYQCRSKQELFQDLSFETISAAGANGAIIHYCITEKNNTCLEPSMLYLVDSGGQYLDGTTDITRTIALEEPTEEQKEYYTRVLKGHIALATVQFPQGTTGHQLDVLARQYLWEVGCDFDHGTGHGVGSYLSVHEGPQRISKKNSDVALREGMILSNEPGYYKEGSYGIRIENLMIVKEIKKSWLGFETLTLAPYDEKLIQPLLLTEKEKKWLRGYYQCLDEKLSPYLLKQTKLWLNKKIQQIFYKLR